MLNEDKYLEILQGEMMVAMGCTEPLAVAYAGSYARHILGEEPNFVFLECSSNIIKNVRCVNVPNSEEFNGIKAAVLLGVYGGDYSKGFGCISEISLEAKEKAKKCIEENKIVVSKTNSAEKLHIIVHLSSKNHKALVEIAQSHLNVVKIIKDDEVLLENHFEAKVIDTSNYESLLTFDHIYEFANEVDLTKLNSLIEREYEYNYAIAKAGMEGNYGVHIGQTMLSVNPSLDGKIIAYTAAASEARMCGCSKPVVINSGSGNQGLSTSVPVIIYGKEKGIELSKVYRALILANLLTIKQKYRIGALSAFCGVVSSCCSAGAAITYLAKGTKEQIEMTMNNHLASIPGMICDGAKASCASKIAVSLSSALLSHHLAMKERAYHEGEGILKESIDETVKVVSDIGAKGMVETDEEIMNILLSK